MPRWKKQFAVSLLAGALGWSCGVRPAQALTVSPGRTEIRLAPGEKMKMRLSAVNDSKEELQVTVSKKDWFVLDANKAWGVDQWMKINGPERFTLKPGQKREIPVTVTCPRGAQGELVGMASFLYQTLSPTMVTPVISVSIYLEVAGTEKVAGEITEVGVRRWQERLQAAVAVKATGTVHLRPTGEILLKDSDGRPVARFPVPEASPAYPGRVQGYLAQVPPDFTLAPGRYRAEAHLNYRDLALSAARDFVVSAKGQIQMTSATQ